MISDRLKELDVNFAVIEAWVNGSAKGDIEMRGDFFGEDFSIEGEDSEIEGLERFGGEEDFVNGDFYLLDFAVVLGFGLVVGSGSVEAI